MTKFTIPGTVLNASTIGLGTSSFGSGIDISTSMDIMDRWIQLGGNLIDTAHAYGSNDPDQKSPSEEVISSAGIPVNSILYHFIRDLSFPTISLMGFRSPDQLESLVTDIETPVPESELNKLRMIREHYAKEDVTDENNI